MLAWLDSGASPSQHDSIGAALVRLYTYDFFVPSTAALNNLVGTGGLTLIQDLQLSIAVTSYAQRLEAFETYVDDLRAFETDWLRPVLNQTIPLRVPYLTRRRQARGYGVTPSPRSTPAVAELGALQLENLVFERVLLEADMVTQSQILAETISGLQDQLAARH